MTSTPNFIQIGPQLAKLVFCGRSGGFGQPLAGTAKKNAAAGLRHKYRILAFMKKTTDISVFEFAFFLVLFFSFFFFFFFFQLVYFFHFVFYFPF